jgi:hypothetical protein
METDQGGDAGGKGGNLKKNRPSWDLHRLKSKQNSRTDIILASRRKIPA